MRIYPPIQYGLIIGADLVRLLHRRRIQQYRQIFKSVFLLLVSDDSAFFVVIFGPKRWEKYLYTPHALWDTWGPARSQTRFGLLSKTYTRKIDRRRHIKPSAAISTSLCLHKPNLTTYNPTPLTWGIAPRNSKSPSPHPFPPGRFGWAFARFVARWVL